MTDLRSGLGRPSRAWRRALPAFASVAAHAGLAVFVLTPVREPGGAPAPNEPGDAAGAVELTLVRTSGQPGATPTAAAPGGAGAVATPPASADPSAPPATAPRASDADSPATPFLQAVAGAAAPAGQVAAASVATLDTDYQRRLLEHIRAFRRSPQEVEGGAATGVVELAFQIDRRGRLNGVWVSHTSGSTSLDAAAVETVRRSAPLPPIPASLPDAMTVTLPVEFSARG